MIHVGKTAYVLDKNIYIHCDEKAVEFEYEDGHKTHLPYNSLSQMIIFYNTALSSVLIQKCSEHNIIISFVSIYGKFQGSFISCCSGSVFLRRNQFNMIDSDKALAYVRNVIGAKLHNSVWTLSYFAHHNEHKEEIMSKVAKIRKRIPSLQSITNVNELRLVEAQTAADYYSAFDLLLKIDDKEMLFDKRTKNPPLNNTNALLSFFYTMMTTICTSALLCRGLDSECGYLHTLRSGRNSLSCDLVEEFRSCIVDRFVITLINRKEITSSDFVHDTNGIFIEDHRRKEILQKWEKYLVNTEIVHPLYEKRLTLKTLPYEQSQLLAQYIRGDIEEYPPFLIR